MMKIARKAKKTGNCPASASKYALFQRDKIGGVQRSELRRQKKCKVSSGGVLSIGSCDLHANGFFIGNDEESLF
jgi:hypothetical protein